MLNSPKQAVVSTLAVSDELTVEYRDLVLVAADKQGRTAGSLVPRQLVELIECIEKGKKYVAIVKKVAGGLCEVEIRPRD